MCVRDSGKREGGRSAERVKGGEERLEVAKKRVKWEAARKANAMSETRRAKHD